MFWKHATPWTVPGDAPLLLFDQTQLHGECQNFRSLLKEVHVLGKSERVGSILGTGRMGKDTELEVDTSTRGQSHRRGRESRMVGEQRKKRAVPGEPQQGSGPEPHTGCCVSSSTAGS